MKNLTRLVLSALAAPALLLVSTAASAYTTPAACGKFDFDKNGLGCEIRVSGGCEADCTSLKFIAGCEGGCTLTANSSCVTDSCGATCMAQCNPDSMNCVEGCHDECEQPLIKDCQAKHSDRDCVADAKASCTSYCRNQCDVPPANSCEEHCNTCCTGACTAQVNMDCDIACYAKLEGGCKVQCQEPTGALFCNDQYVGASDVQGCIDALLTQGLQVDVSARAQGECTITLSGTQCEGDAQASGFGCSTTPNQSSPFAPTALGLGIAAAAIARMRRRNDKRA